MKLLLSADSVGGVWTYALDLCRGMTQHGIEVVLATMGAPLSSAQRAQAAAMDLANLHESSYALEWMREPWDDVAAAGEWLLEVADEEQVDLVHLNTFAHGALDWSVPVLVAGHSCVCSWWCAVHGEDAPADWDRYRAEVARGLAAADEVVAPSSTMLAELQRHHGVRRGIVIANGSSSPLCNESQRRPFVLAAARFWDPAKNMAALASAADSLRWPIIAAGPAAAHDPGGLRMVGELTPDELQRLREQAAIFAAPARYEPFGLAPLEAARAGCALVLGDIPSLREVWGDAALYADPGDPMRLREQLARMIADERLRLDLAKRARRRAARYSLQRMAGAYLSVYERLRARTAVRS